MTDIAEDLAALRTATREAHEVIKDLRAATREAKAVVVEVEAAARVAVDARIEEALAAGLLGLSNSIGEATKAATEAVYERFDTIAEILMGETKSDRRKGHPSIPSLVEQLAAQKRAEAVTHCTRHETYAEDCHWCQSARDTLLRAGGVSADG